MTDMEMAENREIHRDIHDFIQGKIDDGASPPALASMLVFHANKLGFDIDVDPRWVLLNSLQAIVTSLEHQLDKDDVIDGDCGPEQATRDFGVADVVDINSIRTRH